MLSIGGTICRAVRSGNPKRSKSKASHLKVAMVQSLPNSVVRTIKRAYIGFFLLLCLVLCLTRAKRHQNNIINIFHSDTLCEFVFSQDGVVISRYKGLPNRDEISLYIIYDPNVYKLWEDRGFCEVDSSKVVVHSLLFSMKKGQASVPLELDGSMRTYPESIHELYEVRYLQLQVTRFTTRPEYAGGLLVPLVISQIAAVCKCTRRHIRLLKGRCLNCGYHLFGLTGGSRCPECGVTFTHAPATLTRRKLGEPETQNVKGSGISAETPSKSGCQFGQRLDET
jgi:predicted Zn-ribbon and HTH transcriptional regulator